MIMNNAIGGRHVIPPIVPCNESLRLFWKYGVDCPTVATASNRVMTYTPDYESYRIVSYRIDRSRASCFRIIHCARLFPEQISPSLWTRPPGDSSVRNDVSSRLCSLALSFRRPPWFASRMTTMVLSYIVHPLKVIHGGFLDRSVIASHSSLDRRTMVNTHSTESLEKSILHIMSSKRQASTAHGPSSSRVAMSFAVGRSWWSFIISGIGTRSNFARQTAWRPKSIQTDVLSKTTPTKTGGKRDDLIYITLY